MENLLHEFFHRLAVAGTAILLGTVFLRAYWAYLRLQTYKPRGRS